MLARVFVVIAAVLGGAAAFAQGEPPLGQIVSGVLIVDTERLYLESEYGQRIRVALDERARALQAENDRIERQLIAEEQSLTERRPSMSVEAFRAEAAAFDTKVQDIRRARDAAISALEQARVQARDRFYEDVRTVVGQLMLERGAVVLLDRRTVYLAVGAADITAEAVRRIDETLLDGAAPVPDETPEIVAPEAEAGSDPEPAAEDDGGE